MLGQAESADDASRRAGARTAGFLAVALALLVMAAFAAVGGLGSVSADGTCATHYPYKVLDGHGHDGDGDGVGCERNPKTPGGGSSSGSSYTSSGYHRDNWSYNSSSARRRLGCSSSEHVDHIVALKEAYDSGGRSWSLAKKERFANDPQNQWCLDAGLNISKSDGDLAEWSGGSCTQRKHIATVTIAIKAKYGLSIDAAERRANQAALARSCTTTPSSTTTSTTGVSGTTASSGRSASTVTIALSNARTGAPARTVTFDNTPAQFAARRVTAASLFSTLVKQDVVAVWKWTGRGWLMYAEARRVRVPGSTNFVVGVSDSLLVTIE